MRKAKLVLFSSLLSIVLLSSCNNNGASLDDCAVVLKSYEAQFKDYKADSNAIKFSFLNNPFGLGDSDSIFISIDDKLVYHAPFKEYGTLFLKKSGYEGLHPHPQLVIKRAGKWYSFPGKRSTSIGAEDRHLYIVFCPENNKNENFFFFFQKEFIH